MAFILGVLIGFVVGLSLIIGYARFQNVRSKLRSELVSDASGDCSCFIDTPVSAFVILLFCFGVRRRPPLLRLLEWRWKILGRFCPLRLILHGLSSLSVRSWVGSAFSLSRFVKFCVSILGADCGFLLLQLTWLNLQLSKIWPYINEVMSFRTLLLNCKNACFCFTFRKWHEYLFGDWCCRQHLSW